MNYYNRKQTFSLNFNCLVDYKKRFREIKVGFGKSHDAGIYNNSNMKTYVDNLPVPYHVAAEPAYRSFYNIFNTYNYENADSSLLYRAKKQRVVVESAFGIFKMKFKKFSQRILAKKKGKVVKLVKICMFLHNFIIDNN